MITVDAIFVNGSFRPVGAVDLPDNCPVRLQVQANPVSPEGAESFRHVDMTKIYEIMSRSFSDPDAPRDLAARHNEHQP